MYLGPACPEGVPASNWIQTDPEDGFVASLRLYGPTAPFFDQTWIPDDIVKYA
ncbi:DUF1214 domain-containing protein [Streptomyces sp. NPDC051940]|uniref:DUF1214 domain-containing protein n=1 Tax=Streptomyces sp. NPDC051940 TaxID=3155675 RepID=UPI00343F5DD1